MQVRKLTPVLILSLLLIALLPSTLQAELRLPNIFGDGMVLQREKPVAVWGWADPSQKVVVTFAEQSKRCQANASGEWRVELDPSPASFEGRSLSVSSGTEDVILNDVLVGEVWLCGGQSNMEMKLRSTRDADIELPCATDPALRYIRLPHVARPEPQSDFPVENETSPEGNWRQAVTDQAGECSGVGYYFAKRLRRSLNVPVGLIDTSWGGTMAQHWCSNDTLRTIPEMAPYFEDFESKVQAWDDGGGEAGAAERYAADMASWEEARNAPREEGEREPSRPNPNAYIDPSTERQPGGMFNAMILPLAPMSIRGVLFYQGENNSFGESWKPFPKTFPAVISDWRAELADEELPFGIIQIAGWSNRRTMSYDMNHHCNVTREVQFLTWRNTPDTGLIVTFDTNTNGSIHPGRKLPVGERSARWALAEAYDKVELEWQGPVYEGMTIEGNHVVITFLEETNRGLRLDQEDDCGFYIAGEDQVFQHASARVSGENQLTVWNDDVPNPVAVRYGVSNFPAGGLMNGRELPAYPFRTDDWPITPHQSTGEYDVNAYSYE
jgi:sialate O-acetylesterase